MHAAPVRLQLEPHLWRGRATGSLTGRVDVPDQPRDARHPAARERALASIHRRVRRGRRSGRLRRGHHAAARGHRRVHPHRRRHRRGQQGDVRLRRQGRTSHLAAPRDDGQRVPFVRPAPADHAVEGVLRRVRTSATRSRNGAATASSTRWASRCSASTTPQLDVEVIALAWEFYRRLGLRQVNLIVNSLGEPDERAGYVEALRDVLRRRRRRAHRAEPGHARTQPAAGARLQARARPGGDRRRADDRRLPR